MKLYPADILLPDFSRVDGTRWSCVACDQFTSEPEYWKAAAGFREGYPSALDLIVPEAFLGESGNIIAKIRSSMRSFLSNGILRLRENCGVYVERTLSDGSVRRGLVAAVDLEDYDPSPASKSPVRPTEKTVPERIPPRLEVRRGAVLEAPHIMLLADDRDNRMLGRFDGMPADAYSYPLAEGGGYLKGSFVPASVFREINDALAGFGRGRKDPIILAVGDGNHSLATAKAAFEELKLKIGREAAAHHPARYCLCETVSIYDPSLVFETIYRLLTFKGSPSEQKRESDRLLSAFVSFLESGNAEETYGPGSFTAVSSAGESVVAAKKMPCSLPVIALQRFLDAYAAERPVFDLDYIHGADSVRRLARAAGRLGFLFDGIEKSALFEAVEKDGCLPRKTFSMGSAEDKRYYTECRRIGL